MESREILFLFPPGRWSYKALIGGDLQGGSGASNAVINAVLNGAPIVGVAATANRPCTDYMCQPEINKLEDLKGKTLGVTRFGSITDNLTRILLRRSSLEGAVSVRQMAVRWKSLTAFRTGPLRVPSPATCTRRRPVNQRFW